MTVVPLPIHEQPVAKSHLAPALVELASGVDALYLSGRANLPEALLAALEDHRTLAEAGSVPVAFDLGGESYSLSPRSWGHYRYCLDHPDGRVGFTPSAHLPPIRVQPRSAYLHTVGPLAAVDHMATILSAVCGEVRFNVSRMDLYADFANWDLSADDRIRFVCRASSLRTYEEEGRLTGFEFGRRASKTVTARVYDKTADVARTGAAWWLDVWDRRQQTTGPVHRVEFEVSREGLAQFGLSSPDATLAAVGDIWRYCTTDWLTHRSPTGDSNRSRWPSSPEWTCVQQARLVQRTVGAERIKSRLRCTSLRSIMPGLTGYAVTYAALVGTTGIDDTMASLGRRLHLDELVRGEPLSQRIHRRRLEGPHR